MRHQGISERSGVRAGLCRVWALPPDETCAGEARRIFRRAVGGLALDAGVFDDALLMASELAANTLHATEAARTAVDADPGGEGDGTSPRTSPCTSPRAELWLYLRGVGMTRELVCKVFDSYRGWLNGPPPEELTVDMDERGRGLRIVSELSAGRWGYHPTRGRLGTWRLRGKAVWFAVPAPMAHPRLADVTGLRTYTQSVDVTADRMLARMTPRGAARELSEMLRERGFGKSAYTISEEPEDETTVLTFRHGTLLWCRPGSVTLTTPSGHWERWGCVDLIEVVEQAIRYHEEHEEHEELAAVRQREFATAVTA
ncbi:MAG TPA: hypothetical protein VKU39_01615 [Streptosporangiaceae bacterium]|nr:hypothetical protein [Streptosporangiaceae bacterium]